jgi:probable H4MPT-linked C1 transfer pathway protein
MGTVGLDVGGAALKAADAAGLATSLPFPLWKAPELLPKKLQALLQPLGADRIAVTMTGELCDCFQTRAEGVSFILDAVRKAVGPVPIHVFQTDGRFVPVEQARADAWRTAAANWLALAYLAAAWTDRRHALLIDVGSTTTDVIPLRNGEPVPHGRTDPDRLASGELVYQGVVRTPICALLPRVHLRGRTYPTMAELFATTLDAYLVLGELAEQPEAVHTADGRPATGPLAIERLARMIGADATCFSSADACNMAKQVRHAQLTRLTSAVRTVAWRSLDGSVARVVISGQGEFLIRRLLQRVDLFRRVGVVSIAERLGVATSVAACAYAVACLLEQWADRGDAPQVLP